MKNHFQMSSTSPNQNKINNIFSVESDAITTTSNNSSSQNLGGVFKTSASTSTLILQNNFLNP